MRQNGTESGFTLPAGGFGKEYAGQIVRGGSASLTGDCLEVEASGMVLVGLKLAENGGTVLIDGDCVTLSDCSFPGMTVIAGGSGFYAENCEFGSLVFRPGTGDSTAAGCRIAGSVSVSGRNQTLLDCRCGAVRVTEGRSISLIGNGADSIGIASSVFVNLSGNTVPGGIRYDDRDALWGDDLPGALEGTDFAGADASRQPKNDPERFAGAVVRNAVYCGGDFVSPDAFFRTAAEERKELVLPGGIYEHVSPVVLHGIRDLSVIAYGALVRFEKYTVPAVSVDRSDGITVAGLTIDHMKVANAQGTVEAVAEGSVIWRPDEGYGFDLTDPASFPQNGAGLAFKAGERLPFRDCWMTDRVKNEDGTFTVRGGDGLEPGDRLTFRGLASHVCAVSNSGNVTFRDVTVWNGSGFAFNGWQGDGRITLSRCLVAPGMKPEGAEAERMLSSCDASHFSNMRLGPVLEDCVFIDMTDDGTNINGHYAVASYDPGTRAFTFEDRFKVVTGTYASQKEGWRKGDTVRILSPDFRLLGDVTAEGPLEDGRLVLSEVPEIPYDRVILQNRSAQSSGFAVRNCTVERIRSRGLLIKASDGVIEHCTIRDVRMSAVLVKPESHEWPEFGFSENLTIRNNLFVRTGYASASDSLHAPVNVSGDGEATADPAYQLQRNIEVTGNVFEDRCCETALKISHARGVRVRGNVFGPRDCSLCPDPSSDARSPILLTACSDAEISGNVLPPSVLCPAEILPTASDVRGTDLDGGNARHSSE